MSNISLCSTVIVGSASYSAPAVFDVKASFKSQIPKFESLALSMNNRQLQGQWKPHMSVQWAATKKVEISGTFSWTNQYKATLDIATPFER